MEQYSPEALLGLVAAVGVAILLAALLVRALRRTPADATPPITAIPAAAERPAPVVATRASQPAPQSSYAAIAVAQAGPWRGGTAEQPRPVHIDYSGEALNVPPGSSYTAIAVAAACQR